MFADINAETLAGDVLICGFSQDPDNNGALHILAELAQTFNRYRQKQFISRADETALPKINREGESNEATNWFPNSKIKHSKIKLKLEFQYNKFLAAAKKLSRNLGDSDLYLDLLKEVQIKGCISIETIAELVKLVNSEEDIKLVKNIQSTVGQSRVYVAIPTESSNLIPPCYQESLQRIVANLETKGIKTIRIPDVKDSIEAKDLRNTFRYSVKLNIRIPDQPEDPCYRMNVISEVFNQTDYPAKFKYPVPICLAIDDHHGDECKVHIKRLGIISRHNNRNPYIARINNILADHIISMRRSLRDTLHKYSIGLPIEVQSSIASEALSYPLANNLSYMTTPPYQSCVELTLEIANIIADLVGEEEFSSFLMEPELITSIEEALATDIGPSLFGASLKSNLNDVSNKNVQKTIINIVNEIKENPDSVYALIYEKAAKIIKRKKKYKLAALSIARQMKAEVIRIFTKNDATLNPLMVDTIQKCTSIELDDYGPDCLLDILAIRFGAMTQTDATSNTELGNSIRYLIEKVKKSTEYAQAFPELALATRQGGLTATVKAIEIIKSRAQQLFNTDTKQPNLLTIDGKTMSPSTSQAITNKLINNLVYRYGNIHQSVSYISSLGVCAQFIIIDPLSPFSSTLEDIVNRSKDPKATKIILGNNAEYRIHEILSNKHKIFTQTEVEGQTIEHHAALVMYIVPTLSCSLEEHDPETAKNYAGLKFDAVVSGRFSGGITSAVGYNLLTGHTDLDSSNVGHSFGFKMAGILGVYGLTATQILPQELYNSFNRLTESFTLSPHINGILFDSLDIIMQSQKVVQKSLRTANALTQIQINS